MDIAVLTEVRARWARGGGESDRRAYWTSVFQYVTLSGEVVLPLARMLEGMGLTLPGHVREVPIPDGWGETNREPLPASVQFLPPGPEFVPMPVPEGEGTHTGGPWLSPEGEVWKPLDGVWYLPHPRAVPTREAEALAMMAGEPAFPRNWRVERANGRRWLVRKPARILGVDISASAVREEWVLAVEEGLRRFNRRGWGVNDLLVVALDEKERPFILDLSAASPLDTPYEDEEGWFWGWAIRMGRPDLASLRRKARSLATSVRTRGHRYVYLSSRPVEEVRSLAPEAIVVSTRGYGWEAGLWLSWALFPHPVTEEVMRQAKLRPVWQPWRGKDRKGG